MATRYAIVETLAQLIHHPEYAHLLQAASLARTILEGRRRHCVCSYSVYVTFGELVQAVVDACDKRSIPAGKGLGRPDPAWSVAMSLHAKVNHKQRLAHAHLLTAMRRLGIAEAALP